MRIFPKTVTGAFSLAQSVLMGLIPAILLSGCFEKHQRTYWIESPSSEKSVAQPSQSESQHDGNSDSPDLEHINTEASEEAKEKTEKEASSQESILQPSEEKEATISLYLRGLKQEDEKELLDWLDSLPWITGVESRKTPLGYTIQLRTDSSVEDVAAALQRSAPIALETDSQKEHQLLVTKVEAPPLTLYIEGLNFELLAGFERKLSEGPASERVQLIDADKDEQEIRITTEARLSEWTDYLVSLEDYTFELKEIDLQDRQIELKYAPVPPIRLEIKGISYSEAVAFKEYLEKQEELRAVDLRGLSGDKAAMTVYTELSLTDLGRIAADYSGFPVEVTGEDPSERAISIRSLEASYQ